MTRIHEIAPDVFQICTFVSDANLQFHQFLVRDEQPLLFHSGMKSLFAQTMFALANLYALRHRLMPAPARCVL